MPKCDHSLKSHFEFAAHFQNTFYLEHVLVAASVLWALHLLLVSVYEYYYLLLEIIKSDEE